MPLSQQPLSDLSHPRAGVVHGLKTQQHRITIGHVESMLQHAQLLHLLSKKCAYSFLDLYTGFTSVGHSLRLSCFLAAPESL